VLLENEKKERPSMKAIVEWLEECGYDEDGRSESPKVRRNNSRSNSGGSGNNSQ